MNTDTLIQHYAEVRARLYGPRPAVRRLEPPKPEPEPEPEPVAPVFIYVEPPPLNMLAPCSWRFLVALAAARHGQPVDYILSPSRSLPVARARHEAVYLIAKHTTLSLTRMAHRLGRDHTTLLASLRKFPKIDRKHLGFCGGDMRFPPLSTACTGGPLTSASVGRDTSS